jgi:phosphoesterase RecJ-like protein
MSLFLEQSFRFAEAITKLNDHPVLVLGHRRPDGDCIGSQVALTRVLRALGKDARAVNQDPIPRTLQKFVGDTPFYSPDEIEDSTYQVITVDCADHLRVGDHLVQRFPKVDLNIDHHVSNTNYGEENFILSDASATGEILAKFFFDSGYEVDQITAEALYLGICTDTGQFCYSATNASVFEVCRLLCEAGASPSGIAHELYEKEKPGRIQLLQRFLASFRMEFDNRVCIGSILGKHYSETGTKPEDAENFVDYARSLDGVEIGVLLEERDGKIKGSFRAKDAELRVDILAKEFNGGGHACAAGFNVSGSIEEFYHGLVDQIGKHLQLAQEGGLE